MSECAKAGIKGVYPLFLIMLTLHEQHSTFLQPVAIKLLQKKRAQLDNIMKRELVGGQMVGSRM